MGKNKKMLEDNNQSLFYRFIKRSFDFVSSLLAIIILSPLLIIISLVVFLSNPGPIVYGQERVGRNGKHFKVWKFRSMYKNADSMIDKLSEEQMKQYYTEFKIDNDPRITKVGSFLRKTSLDELPQLFNVLFNQMSVIGPRPLLEKEIEKYYGDNSSKLLSLKPGITGYWQAYGRSNITYQSGERQKMEMYYIDNASIALDIKILFKTVVSVLHRDGAK